jgi:hypothetical protein
LRRTLNRKNIAIAHQFYYFFALTPRTTSGMLISKVIS